MANAYTAVGLAQGFRSGMRRNRQERIEDEDRQRRIAAEDASASRQQEADQFTRETRDRTRDEWRQQAGLRDAAATAQKQISADELRRKQAEGLLHITDLALKGQDPQDALLAYSKMFPGLVPEGAGYDTEAQRFVIPDGKGGVTRYAPKELRDVLAAGLGVKPEAPLKPNTATIKSDEQVVDLNSGKPIVTGSDFGKPKPKDAPGLMSVGPNSAIYDPATKKFITPPESVTKPRGNTDWNTLRGAQEQTRAALAKRLGMSLDENGVPLDGKGKPIRDMSVRWSRMTSTTDALVAKYEDTVGAGQVSDAVADAFDGQETVQQIQETLEKQYAKDDVKVPDGKGGFRKRKPDEVKAKAAEDAKKAFETDTAIRRERAEDSVAAMAEQTRRARGEEPAAPAAAPAAAKGAPGPKARGTTVADVVTPQTLQGADPKAVQLFKSDPALFQRLTAKSQNGKQLGVLMPDGTLYYLVGNELRAYKEAPR